MKNINEVVLQGNIGRDPEFRESKFGIVANLNLATNESKKTESGAFEQVTLWHKIIAFGKVAEFIKNTFKKGDGCNVKGKLRYGEYFKNDVKVYTTEIIASEVKFIDRENEPELNGQSIQPQYQPQYQPQPQAQQSRTQQPQRMQQPRQEQYHSAPLSPRTSKGYSGYPKVKTGEDDIPF